MRVGAADHSALGDVSRETSGRLSAYEALLRKWNPAINLVSAQTLDDLWTRHILDSAQLFRLAGPGVARWADLGSGGGFPGLVIAILAAEARPKMHVTLIESDLRKATFLRTVARDLGLSAEVISARIEAAPEQNAQIVSARALAPLPKLLDLSLRHLAPGGHMLFPKGASWREELAEARKTWSFDLVEHPSLTDPQATILEIAGASRV